MAENPDIAGVNIPLGSSLSTIGLTIPAAPGISLVTCVVLIFDWCEPARTVRLTT